MMKKQVLSILGIVLLSGVSLNLYAAEVCKVSMMGRVCFEEGSPEATAAHMKGDAVADASKRKEADASTKVDIANKKVASK